MKHYYSLLDAVPLFAAFWVMNFHYFLSADPVPQCPDLLLVVKPVGNGKLSKRDGAKFGIPVFPLSWAGQTAEESFQGFREAGFLPEAVVNFLALLGWHPDTEQEIFTIEELIQAFSVDQIGKSGARFDYEKAKWFNQKYIQAMSDAALAVLIRPYAEKQGYTTDLVYLEKVAAMMKERVSFMQDFTEQGYYLFEPVRAYDEETLAKKWNPALGPVFDKLSETFAAAADFSGAALEETVKQFIQTSGLKPGEVLPLLRIALAGTMKGPAVFDMAAALGREETLRRLKTFVSQPGLLP